MKLKKIQEGKVKFFVPIGNIYETAVFYNPEAELTRDFSVSALQVFQKEFKNKINVLDALSATGIRGLRYAKEVKGIRKTVLCDKNPIAVKLIKRNINENKLSRKCEAIKSDANVLMHKNVYSVIDIDPFGSPNIFLDSAARSIYHKGFLMVTATDTAPLSGTYPLSCLKKYGIISLKTDYYAELGMRILISYIILTLSRRDRAFLPQLSFATKHYFRVFGKIEHLGKIKNLLKNFGYVMDCRCGNREVGKIKQKCYCKREFKIVGPIYLGKINEKKFISKVINDLKQRKFKLGKYEEKMLNLIKNESDMPPFYYDLHHLAKILKAQPPKIETISNKLNGKGYKVSRTHFCPTAIKTDAPFKAVKELIKK